MNLSTVKIEKPEEINFILGQSHFINTVEDIHETLVGALPGIKFGLAFCEAAGKCLIRWTGNDPEMIALAQRNAQAIGAGHSFILFLGAGFYPINVLNLIKNVPEVCNIFCATANPVEVLVVEADQGRGNALAFLMALRAKGYHPRVVVSDLRRDYGNDIARVFPQAEHHECLLHASKALRRRLPDTYGWEALRNDAQVTALCQAFDAPLKAETQSAALQHYAAVMARREECVRNKPQVEAVFASLEAHWPKLLNGIESDLIPRTNNTAELVIRRFAQHYHNFCGFDALQSADRYLGVFEKITKDPWLASGHLNDITVVTPVFHRGRLVGYTANTCHAMDICGRGITVDALDCYEEAFLIPPCRLYAAGRPQQVLDLLAANVRAPEAVMGDLHAQVSGNAVGAHRLVEMLEEFGLDDIEELSAAILDRSEAGMRRAIAGMPDGEYRSELRLDGFEEDVVIRTCVRVEGDRLAVDYADSSPAWRRAINVVLNYTKAYTTYGVKCVVRPGRAEQRGGLHL